MGHLDLITSGNLCMDIEHLYGHHSVYQTDLEPPYTRIVHYLGVSYTTDIGGVGSVLVPYSLDLHPFSVRNASTKPSLGEAL